MAMPSYVAGPSQRLGLAQPSPSGAGTLEVRWDSRDGFLMAHGLMDFMVMLHGFDLDFWISFKGFKGLLKRGVHFHRPFCNVNGILFKIDYLGVTSTTPPKKKQSYTNRLQ